MAQDPEARKWLSNRPEKAGVDRGGGDNAASTKAASTKAVSTNPASTKAVEPKASPEGGTKVAQDAANSVPRLAAASSLRRPLSARRCSLKPIPPPRRPSKAP